MEPKNFIMQSVLGSDNIVFPEVMKYHPNKKHCFQQLNFYDYFYSNTKN